MLQTIVDLNTGSADKMKQNYAPTRPHLWKAGPDKHLRARRLAFLRSRCQARFRSEPWSLTLEDWYQLWPMDKWAKRGKGKDDLITTRIIIDKGWHKGNVMVKPRRGNPSRHHHHRNGLMRTVDEMPSLVYNGTTSTKEQKK